MGRGDSEMEGETSTCTGSHGTKFEPRPHWSSSAKVRSRRRCAKAAVFWRQEWLVEWFKTYPGVDQRWQRYVCEGDWKSEGEYDGPVVSKWLMAFSGTR